MCAAFASDVGIELESLAAIYGDDCVTVTGRSLRCELQLLGPHESETVTLAFGISDGYPQDECPRLELGNSYIGKHKISEQLRNQIARIPKVYWSAGVGCLYECIEEARAMCTKWFTKQSLAEEAEEAKYRESHPAIEPEPLSRTVNDEVTPLNNNTEEMQRLRQQFFSSEPIIDRKSVFIGHACRLEHPNDVFKYIQALKADKRIERATHNIVAWRCGQASDCDDDGESAAGSRLAHLLALLRVDNVLLVVTRWYGGIHLYGLFFLFDLRHSESSADLTGLKYIDAHSKLFLSIAAH